MTDIELVEKKLAFMVEKKLAFIETCVQELRTLSNPRRIADDLREERFAAHTLQISIQAALDVASHIVSDERLGEPETNRQLFDLLARAGWLSHELADTMHRMVGFRNVVVHGYQALDKAILADLVAKPTRRPPRSRRSDPPAPLKARHGDTSNQPRCQFRRTEQLDLARYELLALHKAHRGNESP